MSHKDYFGNDIVVGDHVVFSQHNIFQVGTIVKITPKQVRIFGIDRCPKNWRTNEKKGTLKYPSEVLKVANEEALAYILRKSS